MTVARLDPRLIHAGMSITTVQLARLWAEHTPPAKPVPLRCPTCGHAWDETAPLCPTAAVVRPLLRKRRHEAGAHVIARLTDNQLDDLTGKKLSTALPPRKDFA